MGPFLQPGAVARRLHVISVHCVGLELYDPPVVFAAITAREFSGLADFVAVTRQLLLAAGHWLAMKGVRPEDEMAHLPADVLVDAVHRLLVPGVEGERHLVVIRKADANS